VRLDAKSAAEYVGVPKSTFYYYVRQGRIPHYTMSPRVSRYEQSDLDAFIQSCRITTTETKNASASPQKDHQRTRAPH
jgi:excisionase family DNA binding protein